MSGDNLHGNQPLKFYSEKITLESRVDERHFGLGKNLNLEQKHKEWSRKLSN